MSRPIFDKLRGTWRVIVTAPGGTPRYRRFATEAKAKEFADEARAELASNAVTVHQAIDRYLAHQRAKELAETTVETNEYRLTGLLADYLDLSLAGLHARLAQRIYDARVVAVKTDTHRSELNEAKMWARWCVKRGLLAANPFEDVEPIGKKKHGKAQLTVDEARRLSAYCLERLTDPGAVGALICLGLGLRSSEVCALEPRDLDDNGTVLIVRGTKTDAARRRVVIPEWLQPALAGALPLGLTRFGLGSRVKTLCRQAKVPPVCPHGLRGTHATLATSAGAASEFVAASLGHSSPAVTERHYAQAGGVATGKAERVALRLVK